MPPDDTKQSEQAPRYRRIPGLRRIGTNSRSILRLADDHLLLCDYRTGFIERYKRFYFRDIEAFIIRRSDHWIAAMIVWAVIAVIFLAIGSTAHWNNIVTAVFVGICGLFIIANLIRGPSCRTHIQTAVQTDRLPMLKRVRKAERILKTLFPLIEQVQGRLEQNPIAADAASPTITSAPSIFTAPAAAIQPIVERPKLSVLHLLTFTMVLLGGALAIWEVNFPSTALFITLMGLFALNAVFVIIALVRQAKRQVHRGAAIIVWLLVISYVLGGVSVNMFFSMAYAASHTRLSSSPGVPLLSLLEMRHMAGFEWVLWTYGIWSVMLAFLGLIFVLRPAPAKAQPPPLPETFPA